MDSFRRTTAFILLFCGLSLNCANQKILHPSPKIGFDINAIDKDGLVGPPGGKVAMNYEFCIPAHKSYIGKIRQIDPNIKIHRKSKGRVACSKTEWLCIGNTHQEYARIKIQRLAEFSFIKRIERSHFE